MTLTAGEAETALRHLGASLRLVEGHVVSVSFDEPKRKPTTADLLLLQRLPRLKDIDFFGTPVDQSVLKSISGLPVESLNLNCTPTDDSALAAMGTTKTLRQLTLMDTRVSDASGRILQGFLRLRSLRIDGTQLTANGIERLLQQPLETLWLDGRQASPSCLAALARSKHLRDLTLVGSEVTDKALASLQGSGTLQKLGLLRTAVTSSGLGVLAALPQLVELTLNGSAGVTETSVDAFTQIKDLRKLWLPHTGVTVEGLSDLVSKLPHVEIWPTPTWLRTQRG